MKKKWLIVSLLIFPVLIVFAQDHRADSMNLHREQNDLEKIDSLIDRSFSFQDSHPDSSLILALQAQFMAKKNNNLKAESRAYGAMAAANRGLGNFPKSLEYSIEQLKIDEVVGSPAKLAVLHLSIASLYANSKDWDRGLFYAKKADSIIRLHKLIYAPFSTLNIGDLYEKKNMLDSALLYTEQSHLLSVQSNNPLLIGTSLNNLGNIYNKQGRYTDALARYKDALPFELSSSDYSTQSETMLGIAGVFEKTGRADSATWYANQSFTIARNNQFTVKALEAAVFLSRVYRERHNIDSAFAYQEVMIHLKDSIESREKVRELQNMSMTEQLRQAELEQQKLEQIQDRAQKLQLLFIGIMIPIFFLFSIVISRRKVHKKLIEFTGIVSVLLFFEYITLLLHPIIAEKSHHSPVVEIIIFVAIALFLTPVHHRIEHWLLQKLAVYNYLKHHRQAAAAPNPIVPEEQPDNPDLLPGQTSQ